MTTEEGEGEEEGGEGEGGEEKEEEAFSGFRVDGHRAILNHRNGFMARMKRSTESSDLVYTPQNAF